VARCHCVDPKDQMERYCRWWQEGYLSCTGRCFDIGLTVSAALSKYTEAGDPFMGSVDRRTPGNGSLMRLAPVPLAYRANPELAIHYAGESSRTTHGAPAAVDACRFYAALILGALNGRSKEELLSLGFAQDAHRSWGVKGSGWPLSKKFKASRVEGPRFNSRILTHLDWSIRFSRLRWAASTAS